MSSKPIRIPGPDHPTTVTATKGRVTGRSSRYRRADVGLIQISHLIME
jgi:hypothetical protein